MIETQCPIRVNGKMSITKSLFLSSVALLGSASLAIAQNKDPEKLAEMRKKWQETGLLQQNHLDKQYLSALERMMKDFTKAGDLDNAIKIRDELTKIK